MQKNYCVDCGKYSDVTCAIVQCSSNMSNYCYLFPIFTDYINYSHNKNAETVLKDVAGLS